MIKPFEKKEISSLDFGDIYKGRYPRGVNLKPGTDLHDDIVKEVMNRARRSRQVISRRFSAWKEMDRTLTAFVPLDKDEEKIKKKDPRKPVSIVIPTTYAALETLLTYDVAAFLNSPIFPYSPYGPEDVVGAKLLERVIEKHVRRFKVALKLHTFWRDQKVYGIGVVGALWKILEMVKRTEVNYDEGVNSQLDEYLEGNTFPNSRIERKKIFEGNSLVNVDPYKLLPDPDTPLDDINSGEFIGYVDRDNIFRLLSEEETNTDLFNIQYLRHLSDATSVLYNTNSDGRKDKTKSPRLGKTTRNPESNIADSVVFYINLIPVEWGLGRSNYPENWYLRVAGDEIIISAKPAGFNHNMFPFATASPCFDGYSTNPISPLEIVHGLQLTTDWFISAHIHNVRKAMHDTIVADPKAINIFDLSNPKPGKVIKTRRSAWGKGIKDFIMQLPITDVTRNHVGDAGFLMGIIKDVTATLDPVRGVRRIGGERVSATEAQQTSQAAYSRLAKAAMIGSLQGHVDISMLFGYHTQQMMSSDTFVKLIGVEAERLIKEYGLDVQKDNFYPVSPRDLDIAFDIDPHDGTLPGANDTQAWLQIFQIMASQPWIGGQFDMVRVFKHIAKGLGAQNVEEFMLASNNTNINVAEPGMIDNMVQQGNAIPVEEIGYV